MDHKVINQYIPIFRNHQCRKKKSERVLVAKPRSVYELMALTSPVKVLRYAFSWPSAFIGYIHPTKEPRRSPVTDNTWARHDPVQSALFCVRVPAVPCACCPDNFVYGCVYGDQEARGNLGAIASELSDKQIVGNRKKRLRVALDGIPLGRYVRPVIGRMKMPVDMGAGAGRSASEAHVIATGWLSLPCSESLIASLPFCVVDNCVDDASYNKFSLSQVRLR